MTKPLPCPFCGHVGLSHNEGSTFRWLMTECNGCGAQCGEERINTLSMERSAAMEQAKEAAIATWNTRAAQRPWVGLTDEDVNRESAPITSQMKLAFHAGMYVAQQILKERNT
jgi:Fe-S-cluster containining protein